MTDETGTTPGAGRSVAVGIVAGIVSAVVVGCLLYAALAAGLLPLRAAGEEAVRSYLLTHPEVIEEAVGVLEDRRTAQQTAARSLVLANNAEAIFNSPNQVVIGNPDGAVTLVEFFDYNCTYCRGSFPDLLTLVASNPDLRVVLKEFPILGQGSIEAAEVAVAVNQLAPERYLDFHAALLTSPGPVGRAEARAAALALGLTDEDIDAVLATDLAERTIEETYSLATVLGLNGTPTYIIGDEVIPGAIGRDALGVRIASVRECGSTSC